MPRISITPQAYVDTLLAIDLCPVEIQGLGVVEKIKDVRWITEIILFPQKCTGGGTELDRYDPNSYRHYWAKLNREGRGQETNTQRLWWHSHVFGSAFFSGTDRGNIEEFGSAAAHGEEYNPWWISIVGNKHHRLNARLDIFWPRRECYEELLLELDPAISSWELRLLHYQRMERMWDLICKNVRIVPSLAEEEPDREDRDE